MREDHARRDRVAMEQPVRIAGFGLERMAEAVAEVEQCADILRLALVGGDDARFGRDAVRDGLVARCAVAREQGRAVRFAPGEKAGVVDRSEEHTSELQSLMRISYAVFCLKKKKHNKMTLVTIEMQPYTNS